MERHQSSFPSVLAFCITLALFLSATILPAQEILVESADPPEAEQDTVNLDVTIKGKGFRKGAEVSFFITGTTDPGGIRVNRTNFRNPSTLVSNIDVALEAWIGNFDIEVRSNGRTGKGTELFRVLKASCDKDLDGHLKTSEDCNGDDCNDGDPTIYAGAAELCDGKDNDCDYQVDEGCSGQDLSGGEFVRAAFCFEGDPCSLQSDGIDFCPDPQGHLYEYWDWREIDAFNAGCGLHDVGLNVSKGGRVAFYMNGGTSNDASRWMTVDFSEPGIGREILSPDDVDPSTGCPDLDTKIFANPPVDSIPPTINPDICIDNLDMRVAADRLFKKGSTRQTIEIGTRAFFWGSDAGYRLEWVDALFIRDVDPNNPDPNLKLLSTIGPNGEDVSLVELWKGLESKPGGGTEQVLIGRYHIPFTILFWRLP